MNEKNIQSLQKHINQNFKSYPFTISNITTSILLLHKKIKVPKVTLTLIKGQVIISIRIQLNRTILQKHY